MLEGGTGSALASNASSSAIDSTPSAFQCDSTRTARVDTGEDLAEDDCFDTLPTDEQIADLLAQRRPDWWICRGCGTRIDARTGADFIVDHVRDCDLVDGAGNPIGDTR